MLASNKSATETMEVLKQEKQQLETELDSIKAVSSRREADRQAVAQKKALSESDRQKLSRLEVKNAQLCSEIMEKNAEMQQLANRMSVSVLDRWQFLSGVVLSWSAYNDR